MKKSDFVKVHIYRPTYKYSYGLYFNVEKINEKDYAYEGTTLLEKSFFEKFKTTDANALDLSYIE